MRYIVRRWLRAVSLLAGVSALCFLFTEMAPGSFFDEMRLNPQISPETIAHLRAHYGLNRPLPVRYFHWLKSVAHGDFGYSVAYSVPVAPLLLERARNTLLLTTTATFITWFIGVPLGVWTANSRGRFFDRLVAIGTSILISIPEVVIAVALLTITVRWRILPVGGMVSLGFEESSTGEKIHSLLLHLLLPASILVLGSVAIVERHVRSSVLEVLSASYIQAARGLGVSRTRLLFRHVLPAAANPVISLFGLSLAGLLGGSLVVEAVTGWPGLGPLIIEATLARDLYVVIGAVMLSAAFLLAGSFTADLLLIITDPRIRSGEADAR